jgi:hypothetical protein
MHANKTTTQVLSGSVELVRHTEGPDTYINKKEKEKKKINHTSLTQCARNICNRDSIFLMKTTNTRLQTGS